MSSTTRTRRMLAAGSAALLLGGWAVLGVHAPDSGPPADSGRPAGCADAPGTSPPTAPTTGPDVSTVFLGPLLQRAV